MPHRTPTASTDRYVVLVTAKDLLSLLKLMQTNLTLRIKNRGREVKGKTAHCDSRLHSDRSRLLTSPASCSEGFLHRTILLVIYEAEQTPGCSSIADLVLQMEQQCWFVIGGIGRYASVTHWCWSAERDADAFITSVYMCYFFLAEDVCFAAESMPNVFIFLSFRKVCFFVQKEIKNHQNTKSISIWTLSQPLPPGWPLLSLPWKNTTDLSLKSHVFSPGNLGDWGKSFQVEKMGFFLMHWSLTTWKSLRAMSL